MSGRVDGNSSINRQIGNSQAGNSTSGVQDNRINRDYAKLQILYNEILSELSPSMQFYSEGQFDSFLNSTPNILKYTRLLNNDNTFYYTNEGQLDSYKYNPLLVDNFRFVTNRIIDIIKQAASEHIKVINLTAENTELKTYKKILEDSTLLRDYLESVQNSNYLFSAEATLQVNPSIKIWYEEYLRQHGPPGDGVFNSELLAAIIEDLINSDQISEEQLIF